MSIRTTYHSDISVVETFTGDFVSAADATATFNGLSEDDILSGSTSVPVTKHADYSVTMGSGSATINLASLPGKTSEETVVGTGLKVQLLKFRNKSTNANKITVAKGGSSGYGLCASGDSWSVVLSPGQSALFILDEAAPDIASGARTIDVTGTGAQILEIQIVMG